MKAVKSVGYFIGLPVVLLLVWWVMTSTGEVNFFVPTPAALIETIGPTWLESGRLQSDVLPSIGRLLTGLTIAIVVGVLLGLLLGLSRTVRDYAEPLFEFFRAIPPPIVVPVLMLIVGINDGMQISVIVFASIWPIVLNTVEGVRAVDSVQTETSLSYGFTGLNRVRYQVLPSALPQIFTGIQQALPIGLILMVISEMFGASSGLGLLIVQFQRTFAIAQMWSGILLLGLIGIALSVVLRLVRARALAWYFGLKEMSGDA